jgi:hypothetical protein
MTYDEAYSEAVQGAWVRPIDLQPGAWISYGFDGLRINFPGGSSSGWTAREHDRACEWETCGPPEAPRPAPAPSKWGPGNPTPKTWGDVFADMERVEGGWRDKGSKPDALAGFSTPVVKNPATDKWGRKHGQA